MNYGSLVLCGLLLMGSTTFAAAGNKITPAKRQSVAKTKVPQIIIKMSATRELLSESDTDHIGSARGQGGRQVIVEMAPDPVTIVIDAKKQRPTN